MNYVLFDGTCNYVNDQIDEDTEVVFKGTFEKCAEKCDELNENVYDGPRKAYS